MKYSISIILYLVFVTGLQACPEGEDWIFWSKSCYLKPNRTVDFTSAYLFCYDLGSSIVNINSETENNFVYNTFVLKPKYSRHFIGVMRESEPFVTSDGNLLDYTNWGKNQPDRQDFDKNCGVMENQGFWSNFDCQAKLSFICESKITCKTKPCKNGGSCVDLPDGNTAPYRCLCPGPFYGKNCEKRFRGCDTVWTAFGHHCYRAFPGPRPWSNARIVCQRNNADLAAVESPEENAFLQKSFIKHNIWLGMKECLYGKRCTVNFSKLRYKNWDACEPRELDDEEAKGCSVLEKKYREMAKPELQ